MTGIATQHWERDPHLFNIAPNYLSNTYPEALGPFQAEPFMVEPSMTGDTVSMPGVESVLFDPPIPYLSTIDVYDIEMSPAESHIYSSHSNFATMNVPFDNALFKVNEGGNWNHANSMYLDSNSTVDFL